MRLDVRVEGGKDRVPSEIGTEPDRVGVRAMEDVPTPGARRNLRLRRRSGGATVPAARRGGRR